MSRIRISTHIHELETKGNVQKYEDFTKLSDIYWKGVVYILHVEYTLLHLRMRLDILALPLVTELPLLDENDPRFTDPGSMPSNVYVVSSPGASPSWSPMLTVVRTFDDSDRDSTEPVPMPASDVT